MLLTILKAPLKIAALLLAFLLLLVQLACTLLLRIASFVLNLLWCKHFSHICTS